MVATSPVSREDLSPYIRRAFGVDFAMAVSTVQGPVGFAAADLLLTRRLAIVGAVPNHGMTNGMKMSR